MQDSADSQIKSMKIDGKMSMGETHAMPENRVEDTLAYPILENGPSRNLLVARPGGRWPVAIMFCTLAFIVCMLFSVTPLLRMVDPAITLHIALGSLVGAVSNWLPFTIGSIHHDTVNSLEFFGSITLAFLAYGLGMVLVARQREGRQQFPVRCCIWLATILAGAFYIVTPTLLSHDTMVYAGYGRLLAVYRVNPYFVPLAVFPHDPLTPLNQWAQSTSAYGPLWILVCGFWGALLKGDATTCVLAFRLFASAANVCNIWLIGRTLQATGRSPRAVTLGMLVYAWNPLVLLESSLDGHNDVFMILFALLGMLLAVRAERSGQLLRARGYLLPTVAFTLAALVKFTALPILAAYLLFLACKALRPTADSPQRLSQALRNWQRAVQVLLWSGVAAMLVAVAFYGPFWLGHSLHAIALSFTNVPSSTGAKHSFLYSVILLVQSHSSHAHNFLLVHLSHRRIWDDLTYLALALCLLLGAYRLWLKPGLSTFRTLVLALMCIVLLITPWFYPWYITWLVGLAAICLPRREQRTTWALFALALTFSYSALSFYIIGFLGARVYLWPLFNTLPPVCAFLLCWLTHPALFARAKSHRSTGEKEA